ncbi:MAG: 50S ribosomal protein L9 [Candidatus Sungiibacteriota bacterium]|uniref:Large ribosomal subunit protein bL9 n=1 Tax=Candidatus Sungiibacteriota bacterium TaxID=2750080 RepID=A0A7T5RJF3_9BACT|nr:MAG: 50S ribosomal protein L9 [Candidatus Sungbacteria bacterium]
MKVLLLQDITTLGKKNDVKDVSDGYARNFLFPRNLAKPATEAALKNLVQQKVREEHEKSEEYQKYKALVDKLKSLTLSFRVRIGEKGRAYGSVTAVKIRDALKKQGIEVNKEWVLLEEPIKTAEEKVVRIKLPQEFKGGVKIIVEAE